MEIIEKIRHALNSHGLKVTPQRIAVYRALLQLNNHPDTDQIIAKVTAENPTISSGTIYKTLDTFAEYNIISRIKTDTGRMRFDHITENHHHLYDKSTDRIEDYMDDDLNELIAGYFKKKNINGFEPTDIKLQIIGKFSE
jgi:Fur family peroxide stress response transcriptional regulator